MRPADAVWQSAPQSVPQVQGLLTALRQLPDAMPMQPMMWAPRRCKQAASEVLREVLESAVSHCQAEAGDEHAECAHRLLRAVGCILFRAPDCTHERERGSRDDSGDDDGPKVASVVRERLQKAVGGKWQGLVEELIADIATIQAQEGQ